MNNLLCSKIPFMCLLAISFKNMMFWMPMSVLSYIISIKYNVLIYNATSSNSVSSMVLVICEFQILVEK